MNLFIENSRNQQTHFNFQFIQLLSLWNSNWGFEKIITTITEFVDESENVNKINFPIDWNDVVLRHILN